MQIATTAFVKAALVGLVGLVGSSPAALDILKELAAALGNDPSFAISMTSALAGKQPLDATLTNLSGKTIGGIYQYLGMGDGSKMDASEFTVGSLNIAGNKTGNKAKLIFQWGIGIAGGSSSTGLQVTFPVIFPSVCYGIVSGNIDGDFNTSSIPCAISDALISANGFKEKSSDISSDSFFYLSIGE